MPTTRNVCRTYSQTPVIPNQHSSTDKKGKHPKRDGETEDTDAHKKKKGMSCIWPQMSISTIS